ncbi:hypothetical protein [Nitratireductor sp. GCM10026969]|uniref:hypothetical protein n=1 Tax=Nitratireductor sp. GCM10026969 TaxID=3252645 RepID=UPI00361D512D
MSGREIIARAIYDALSRSDGNAYIGTFEEHNGEYALGTTIDGSFDLMAAGDHLQDILTAAGYRIVGPGSLDDDSLERAAQEMERQFVFGTPNKIAEAIRALKNRGRT